jgi:hypothetical protein
MQPFELVERRKEKSLLGSIDKVDHQLILHDAWRDASSTIEVNLYLKFVSLETQSLPSEVELRQVEALILEVA